MNISEKVKEADVEELTECPECDSEHIVRDYKRGEVTCKNCGLVVDDQVIDQGPADLFILNMANNFHKKGHEVKVMQFQ